MSSEEYYKHYKSGLLGVWVKSSTFISYYIRKRIFNLFMGAIKPDKNASILDVGVTPEIEHKAANFFERFYPWTSNITGVGIDDAYHLEKIYPGFKYVKADAKNLPFKDKSFDVVFSSAVMEHVGSQKNQKQVILELLRVGKKVFITTPDRLFPIDAHTGLPFLHYLSKNLHRKILKMLGIDFFAKEENLNLLTKRELQRFFPYKVIRMMGILIAYKD